jgi:hypothetical protein
MTEHSIELELRFRELEAECNKSETRLADLEMEIKRKEHNLSSARGSAFDTITASLGRVTQEADRHRANMSILKPQKDTLGAELNAAEQVRKQWRMAAVSPLPLVPLNGRVQSLDVKLTLRHFHTKYLIEMDQFDTYLLGLDPNICIAEAAAILRRYGPLSGGFIIVDETGEPRQSEEPLFMLPSECDVVVDFLPVNVCSSYLKTVRTRVWARIETLGDADIVGVGIVVNRTEEHASLAILIRDGSSRLDSIQELIQETFGHAHYYQTDLFVIPFVYEFMPMFTL